MWVCLTVPVPLCFYIYEFRNFSNSKSYLPRKQKQKKFYVKKWCVLGMLLNEKKN
jgi:hypothetical protein